MNCLTWNLEWAPANSRRASLILESVSAADPDVVCFTEVHRTLMPPGHLLESSADYGYPIKESRRKVILWSRQPWTEIDLIGDETLPSGRFVSGVSGGIRFVGVCIPWKDAHVRTGRRDRKPWEDHIVYCGGLATILERDRAQSVPICLLGDFNQRIPRINQPPEVYAALMNAVTGLTVATSGLTDRDGRNLIDHIAVTPHVEVSINGILSKTADDGTHLSDHAGVHASIHQRT